MEQGDPGQSAAGNPAAAAGWYPVDGGMQRYWDGQAWTEHIAPASAPAPAPAPPPQTPAPFSDPGPTTQFSGPGPDPTRPTPPGPAAASADAPTPWVGGSPADQTPESQSFAAPPPSSESQPFSVPAPGLGAYPGPVDQPVPPALVSADDKSMALLLHLLSLVVGFLGPLIIWLTKRDQSPFIDHHGKTALNFQFSLFVYWIGTFLAIFFIVGLLIVPVLLVIQILFPILAAVAANRGEYYRYPLAIPFIR